MILRGTGILKVTPPDVTKKHEKQSEWKKVAIIETNDDLALYYKWFLRKRFNLFLLNPLRGSHITIINDRINHARAEIMPKFDNLELEFFYDITKIRSNANHWWMNLECPQAEEIRKELGLAPKPYFGFHLTLGLSNEKNLAHSQYILDSCMRFNL